MNDYPDILILAPQGPPAWLGALDELGLTWRVADAPAPKTTKTRLAILAIDEPGPDADELCQAWRLLLGHKIGLLVVTSCERLDDALGLLEAGADDLFCWPTRPELLASRVRSLLRREPGPSAAVRQLAHDLRLPLFTVQGYCGLLRDGALGPLASPQLEALGSIHRGVARIEQLLDELLAAAAPEPSRRRRERATTLLSAAVDEACTLVAGLAAARGVVLELRLAPDLPAVRGERTRLALVFANLLSNAFRCAPVGSVVRVEARAVPDGVLVAVVDRGPGVPPVDRARIFERGYETSGGQVVLGLSVAADLVGESGGALWLESPPEGGASFCLRLPTVSG